MSGTGHRSRVQRTFVAFLMLGITLLMVMMIRDFITPLFLAAIVSGLMTPVYRRILRWCRGETVASLATVILAVMIIVLPLSVFLGVLANEARQVSEVVIPIVQKELDDPAALRDRVPHWLPFREYVLPYRSQIAEKIGELTGKAGATAVKIASSATQGTARFVLDLFVMLYAMFFFLIDGRSIITLILHSVPLAHEDQRRMLDKGLSVTRAMLKGSLVIGVVQGVLGGLAFWVVGIEGPVFWGTIMAVLSLLPGLGVPLVWIPAVIYLFFAGAVVSAVGLTVWCAGVVGTVDNVLRPRLVGADTKMPDLLILLSTLGGLSYFGTVGLIAGPIVAALFMTVWDMYRSAFADLLGDSTAGDG
jgi:predicted PurR-regulated permease PerM